MFHYETAIEWYPVIVYSIISRHIEYINATLHLTITQSLTFFTYNVWLDYSIWEANKVGLITHLQYWKKCTLSLLKEVCRKDASTGQYLVKEIMKGLGGFGVVFLFGWVGLGWVFKDFTDRGVSRYQETLSTSGIMPLSGSFFS